MTADGLNAFKLGYNYLNLIGEVSDLSGDTQATYRWLADGTKAGARNATGGYEYLGSLTYQVDGAALRLKDAAFGAGRIIACTEPRPAARPTTTPRTTAEACAS